jgi:hypothetical protein
MYSGLLYRCQVCKQLPRNCDGGNSRIAENPANSPTLQQHEQMRQDFADLQASVCTMASSITQLTSQLDSIASKLPNSPITTEYSAQKASCPSYADILSAGMMKSAMSQAIREHHQAVSDKASVVIYGMPEDNHDQQDVLELLDFLGYPCHNAQHTRLGRPVTHKRPSAPRPIKLELKSANDVTCSVS